MLPKTAQPAGHPRPVTCITCGEPFIPGPAAGDACPHCGTVGYVDRAGRSFLPLGWTCGAANDAAENAGDEAVCAACGASRGRLRHPAKAGGRDAPPPDRPEPAARWRPGKDIALIAGLAFAATVAMWAAARLIPAIVAWWATSGAAAWLAAFGASLADLPSPDDPEYTYLFATVVFQIALLPVAVYLLARLIRRLFP